METPCPGSGDGRCAYGVVSVISEWPHCGHIASSVISVDEGIRGSKQGAGGFLYFLSVFLDVSVLNMFWKWTSF